jgi:hypothetical protein
MLVKRNSKPFTGMKPRRLVLLFLAVVSFIWFLYNQNSRKTTPATKQARQLESAGETKEPGTGMDSIPNVTLLSDAMQGHEILKGRVIDASGLPVEGAAVTIYSFDNPGETEKQSTTDAEGRFAFEGLLDSFYSVRAYKSAPGLHPVEAAGEYAIQQEESLVVHTGTEDAELIFGSTGELHLLVKYQRTLQPVSEYLLKLEMNSLKNLNPKVLRLEVKSLDGLFKINNVDIGVVSAHIGLRFKSGQTHDMAVKQVALTGENSLSMSRF